MSHIGNKFLWHRRNLLLLFLTYGYIMFAMDVKVITFNIRYDSGRDGVNCWQNRKELLQRFLIEQDADIICLQEVLHQQYAYLKDQMQSYGVVGNGRNDGKEKGEYAPIYYKSSRYDLIDNGMFWLSENPSAIGSIGWDAKQPRIVTWAKLREKEFGKTFIVLNTHFDDIGRHARMKSAELIMGWISQYNLPTILAGDFNDDSRSVLYMKLSNNPNGLIDTHTSALIHNGVNYSFHNFGRIPSERRAKIDYIFVKGVIEVKSEKIQEENNEVGFFLSDHNPVIVVLSL